MIRFGVVLSVVMVLFASGCVAPSCQVTGSPVYTVSEPTFPSGPGVVKHGQSVWNPEVPLPAGANVKCS